LEQRKVIEPEVDQYSPPSEKLVKSTTDDLILDVLREFKISYPNEIAAQTGYSQQTILARLAYLRAHGVVERVMLGRSPPDDLVKRFPQLWELGLKGSRIKMCAWHRLVDHEAKEK
jgi:DNA-binding transcriptional ArsR family regulator